MKGILLHLLTSRQPSKTPSLCLPLHYKIGKINFLLYNFSLVSLRGGFSEGVIKTAKELEMCSALVHVNLCVFYQAFTYFCRGKFCFGISSSLSIIALQSTSAENICLFIAHILPAHTHRYYNTAHIDTVLILSWFFMFYLVCLHNCLIIKCGCC